MAEPKIIHSTLAKDRRKLRTIVQAFAKKMGEMVDRLKSVDQSVFSPDGTILLDYRKRLVASVREGMLERKDLELEIGVTSALVWFMRLTQEEKDRVMDLW